MATNETPHMSTAKSALMVALRWFISIAKQFITWKFMLAILLARGFIPSDYTDGQVRVYIEIQIIRAIMMVEGVYDTFQIRSIFLEGQCVLATYLDLY